MASKKAGIFTPFAQRALFCLEQFTRDEMANHAAAGAYAFLLSAAPGLLVVLYASSLITRLLGLDMRAALASLEPYLEAFGGSAGLAGILEGPGLGAAGAIGAVSLIWAARLFVVSIQRGVRVVYAGTAPVNPVREGLLTFVVELIFLFAVIALLAASQAAKVILAAIGWEPARSLFAWLAPLASELVPMAALWLFVFLTFLKVPQTHPKTAHALIASLLCIVSYAILGSLLNLALNPERYGILYGILGSLVLGLIKVYSFFWLYFFFVELTFTLEHFDSLLFARFHRLDTATKGANRLERALFGQPERLTRRYARTLAAGSVIFKMGDESADAYYLYKGRVHIYLDDPAGGAPPVSSVSEGEFFGELALILDETRSAWAVAAEDVTVFRLPAALFRTVLDQDPEASRRLVTQMASRLSANNRRIKRSDGP